MSSIRFSLEKLDHVVGKLDSSVANVERAMQDYVPAGNGPQFQDSSGNVVDIDFVAKRLDKAIETVQHLLEEEG